MIGTFICTTYTGNKWCSFILKIYRSGASIMVQRFKELLGHLYPLPGRVRPSPNSSASDPLSWSQILGGDRWWSKRLGPATHVGDVGDLGVIPGSQLLLRPGMLVVAIWGNEQGGGRSLCHCTFEVDENKVFFFFFF